MKKIKTVMAGIAALLLGAAAMAVPAMAASCPSGTLRAGEDLPTVAQCNLPKDEESPGGGDLFTTIQGIINWVLAALGIVAVIMMIIGGVTYMTSQGDPGKTKKAKDTILYGIIGLIVALLAYAIVNFVLANIFGNSGTNG